MAQWIDIEDSPSPVTLGLSCATFTCWPGMQIVQLLTRVRHLSVAERQLAEAAMGATSRVKDDQSPELTLSSLSVPHDIRKEPRLPCDVDYTLPYTARGV